ncbi:MULTISPECIES: TetR/AcrR family transcriptional regulator [unclassified Nocardia]|uniref:TetR/AcrR family transcriptional regulator n=1 Tax=unclassified Nocardia TaxID=2637762 RepID=UPI001CE46C53|nr:MULTISPECIES: TetR/AcrR family transcriptional regulator [unclassified Nocardia]
MTQTVDVRASTRTRLLDAAAQLLAESSGSQITTRAICELAGVQAPTLYHHFGDKQGLLDAVAAYGFEQYLNAKRARKPSDDPFADIRYGWDRHTEFALANPALYAVMYGQVVPGKRPAAAADAESLLLGLLTRAAEQGRLTTTPETAAQLILAANVGVALALITMPPEQRDTAISDRTRDAILTAIASPDTPTPSDPDRSAVSHSAIALHAALSNETPLLSTNETALLKDWLRRLAD